MSSRTPSFTIGVEEEYQIIHPATDELSSASSSVLPIAQQSLGEKAQPELQQSQVEAASPVCQTLEDVRTELTRMRREMLMAAQRRGKYLAAAGTHPFSHWKDQRVTPKERYQEIADEYQQLAREAIFGCHVHIGLEDREMAIQVMNRARVWLAPILALSANSPFRQGVDTGFASFRSMIACRWPTSGQPHYFASFAEYQALVQALIAVGSIEDSTRIYWDIRPSERFPTLEFRVADCCMTIDESVRIILESIGRKKYMLMSELEQEEYRPHMVNIPNAELSTSMINGSEESFLDPIDHKAWESYKRIEPCYSEVNRRLAK